MDDHASQNELSLFLASTAHDMKNSISVLAGTLEKLLADQPPQQGGAYPQMAHMLYQTKRLNDNLIQLLALYKQVGTPEYPFDVQPIELETLVAQVSWSVAVLVRSKEIEFITDYDPSVIWHLDEDLIIGVIGHAIHNAIHYTGDKVLLKLQVVDDELEIRVEDNGEGYPGSMIEAGAAAMSGQRAGVNFLTNSTGLGLFFCSEVAKMHKHRERRGSLRLENGGTLGGGCFVLRLP
jgi:signal transduction histidine kinase